jgi:peroxiredoxin
VIAGWEGWSVSEPVETLEGWYVLHDFRTIDWPTWRRVPPTERQEAVGDLLEWAEAWQAVEEQGNGSGGLYRIAGHRADLLIMTLRPTLEDLLDVKWSLNRLRVADVLTAGYSYVSVVELSAYLAHGNPDPATNPALRARLWPRLPKLKAVSFYPMSKRRQGADNWYMMDKKDRAHLMKGHGAIGHKYHDRVIQLISGSQGLDDWEWGVTLFADDPVAIKKLVYEMRFDEASARFAEFGPFLVGTRIESRDLPSVLMVP